jgi:hypothetical protein
MARESLVQQAHKTTDLTSDERAALERLLSRRLGDDEAVEVITHKVPEIPVVQETESRKRAMARILELAKGKSLGGATIRELIDEGRRF